ncbi:DNA protecting protein DprA [Citrobacter koseri]|uniref:DNA protecting protein DprA n=1 Tax=Citrobacter koseri TaxID=545 RepID=A0A2X2W8G7_CITKO|nr:DNA protecting protein DprA [Citrobacter koseri]
MTRTEIWLRLMHVSELYGDAMLSIANLLIQQRQIDKTLLQNAGLTSRQAERFLTVPQKALDDAQHWLEQPHHHLILAGSARYPAQLNAIADYPGAFFVAGDPECLQNFQLGVVGSRTPSWYGERWGAFVL